MWMAAARWRWKKPSTSYMSKIPGPSELLVENHSYDVSWINPIDGDEIKSKKGYHGEHFTGEPPDRSHDWVLHVSREGHKAGMLKSIKFESDRRIILQTVEQTIEKVPFAIDQPTRHRHVRSETARIRR